MPVAKLIHNPGAGEEEHTPEDLISLIESKGYTCKYSSVKDKEWDEISSDIDFLIIAGGDGTVRQVAKKLLNKKLLDKPAPLTILPLGTANNIATTLNLNRDINEVISKWNTREPRNFDVGKVTGLPDNNFLIESMGFGTVPQLIQEFKKKYEKSFDTPEEEIRAAQQLMHHILQTCNPAWCHISLDGKDYSDEYIIVEIMNIKAVGPKLLLAPHADPGDGVFDVVMVKGSQREALANYLQDRIHDRPTEIPIQAVKARTIKITWKGSVVHVDDEVVKLKKPIEVEIELKSGLLDIIMPE
ncbi:diacylglycerol kinase family protein [Telluribacter sp. SYSU D00476]|uniref:diacylglycerol/lipid kinase family protein n=1 Tax=Telluribacter sp. SYSU D00476 TaxID=2811430 RepID=UPI001FF42B01|nr:diacylglycerol kinase family protein [Telluribacter sp. SYSU D00476]